MPDAPVVHPTGHRHVPVIGFLRRPSIPQAKPSCHVQPSQIKTALQQDPDLSQRFRAVVRDRMEHHNCLNECLKDAWRATAPKPGAQPHHTQQPRPNLKAYWQIKRLYKLHLELADMYNAPPILYIADCGPAAVVRHFPQSISRLMPVFQAWRSAIAFHNADRSLRKQVRLRKRQQFDDLVMQAQQAEQLGLSAVYKLIKRYAPKSSKRSTHFRDPQGQLLTPMQELEELKRYFEDVYQSRLIETQTITPWQLPNDIYITLQEVQAALHSLPANKALPVGDAPALLWKEAQQDLAPRSNAL